MLSCWGFWRRGAICLGLPCACCWWKGFSPWWIMGRGSLRFSCRCWWWGNSCLWWCCWWWWWCMGWWDGSGLWCGSCDTGGPCIKFWNSRKRRSVLTGLACNHTQSMLMHPHCGITIEFQSLEGALASVYWLDAEMSNRTSLSFNTLVTIFTATGLVYLCI